eukprot:TRINITY_DN4914_c0_g1_i1.p1 TRINITY_DN4914_c0_g1~~TRINITY_DN4914_c0_g1_i1.p1  ORF type:complete len:313 (+),score=86.38 TRINITY_DN4914_c0_g1_i1:86-940(+)
MTSWFACCCAPSKQPSHACVVDAFVASGKALGSGDDNADVEAKSESMSPKKAIGVSTKGGRADRLGTVVAGDTQQSSPEKGSGVAVAAGGGGGGGGGGGARSLGESKAPSKPTAVSPVAGKVTKANQADDIEEDTMSGVSKASTGSIATTSSVASELINERIAAQKLEVSRVQGKMKTFVRTMVRGQNMGVVSPDGQDHSCTCFLDKRLKHFSIELKGKVRKIPLTSVVEVFQGKEPEDIATPLDEFCSTLMLEQEECLTFHFPTVPARETFAVCLQLLVDGQR